MKALVVTWWLIYHVIYASSELIFRVPLIRSNGQVGEALNDDRYKEMGGNLAGRPGQGYYIEMLIGTPPQKLNVLVDTGSSNFAVAAAANPDITLFFNPKNSSTFVDMKSRVYVPYTQGNWEGPLATDVVQFLTFPNHSIKANIACITGSSQFFINGSNWQGILGLAYSDIARPDSSLKPFFDSMVEQTHINNLFSLQLCGSLPSQKSQKGDMTGTLIFGGIDKSLHKAPILYTPIYKRWYYEVILTDIEVAGTSLHMDCKEYNFDKTIVDSGTTNLRLPSRVFNILVNQMKLNLKLFPLQIPTDKFWSGLDIVCWKNGFTQFDSFPSITLSLLHSNSSYFKLIVSPQQYLRPIGPDFNPLVGQACYKFSVAPSTSGTVIGAVVMEGFYVIFDRQNDRIGFAPSTTDCNSYDVNAKASSIEGPFNTTYNIHDCAYVKPKTSVSAITIVSYVMAAVCVLCIIPVIISLIQWQWQRCRRRSTQSDKEDLIQD